MSKIRYSLNPGLDLDDVIAIYRASGLGERRPVDCRESMEQMYEESNLIVAAHFEEKLIGIARTLTDHCFVAYLADLAVDKVFQKRGVGKELIQQTRQALKPECLLVLLSAPAAVEYYPHIGFEKHHAAFILPPGKSFA